MTPSGSPFEPRRERPQTWGISAGEKVPAPSVGHQSTKVTLTIWLIQLGTNRQLNALFPHCQVQRREIGRSPRGMVASDLKVTIKLNSPVSFNSSRTGAEGAGSASAK